MLPLFPGEVLWSNSFRAVIYMLALIYFFFGIAIIADIFMAAIEQITSKAKRVAIPQDDGSVVESEVQVWNATVANLTLMALGSSAPEILLAVVETCGSLDRVREMNPKDGLGPSTIVGSAAFNLMAIIGICIMAIKDGDKRDIRDIKVFNVTAFFSVFAYVWMLIVLEWSTPQVVTLAEAYLTLLFFPVLVGVAYGQDEGWKWCGGTEQHKVGVESHIAGATHGGLASVVHANDKYAVAKLLHEEQQEHPDMDMNNVDGVAKFTAARLAAKQRWSRLHYRINGIRKFTGGRRVVFKRSSAEAEQLPTKGAPGPVTVGGPENSIAPQGSAYGRNLVEDGKGDDGSPDTGVRISFTTAKYSVSEGEPHIKLKVERTTVAEQDVQKIELRENEVSYETSNCEALAGEDYVYTSGKLKFVAGERTKEIAIPIIDDNKYEEDERFFVTLRNVSNGGRTGAIPVAEVTIIDDDEPGTFTFDCDDKGFYNCCESDGTITITISRSKGSDGIVKVKYATKDISAVAGKDYKSVEGTLEFQHGETRKSFEVAILNDQEYEKDEQFEIKMEIENFPSCGAKYGTHQHCVVNISDDEQFKNVVDQVAVMLRLNLDKFKVETDSWKEQFQQALSVFPEEEGDEPETMDYWLHFASMFWKVMFAFCPPTTLYGGYPTFVISLGFIGLLTVVVGDLASMFGCCIGVTNSVTAITFVALGTSLPDTFASKTAAENDDTADASIGNVTGSNAVNVFLGLGIPWVIAAHMAAANDVPFLVYTGALTYSVFVFLTCAACLIGLIYYRRWKGWGELGGPPRAKRISAACCFGLWGMYVLFSILQAEGIIQAR